MMTKFIQQGVVVEAATQITCELVEEVAVTDLTHFFDTLSKVVEVETVAEAAEFDLASLEVSKPYLKLSSPCFRAKSIHPNP